MAVFQPSGNHVLYSVKPCDLSSCTKSEIKKYFENSYDLYETLFKALKDESTFYKCPDRLRLPMIFYFGHTAALYVNKLVLAGLLQERVNFYFETLFETGVDENSWDDTENFRMGGQFVWPKVSEVADYRKKVRQTMLDVIENTPLELPVTQDSKWWAVFMGCEHERVHFEMTSVMIRQMPVELVTTPAGWKNGPITSGVPVLSNPLIQTTETYVSMGKPDNFPSYGWDNEYGLCNVKVPPFKASKYLITNREYLEFVNCGGYENSSHWTKEGWQWKQYRKANHPTFWVCGNRCKSGCGSDLSAYSHCNLKTDVNHNKTTVCPYKFRAVFEVMDVPMDWPVEVNYHEAKAFCAWKGPEYRLPTEAEHHVMRGPQEPPSIGTACDIIYQDKIEANINMAYGSSTPVNMYPPSEAGFCDVSGNVWEWGEDHFNGFDGFKTHLMYEDFSTPQFDGRHNMIMGGSWVSTGDEGSRFTRFAFRRHFFQHLGFRLARSVADSPPVRLVATPVFILGAGVLNNDVALPAVDASKAYIITKNAQYFDEAEEFLHTEVFSNYGDILGVESDADSFRQLAHVCHEAAMEYECTRKKALNIMCSVGRFSYELSKYFDKVIAIDHSGRLLDAAIKIQQGETLENNSAKDWPLINIPLAEIEAKTNGVTFKQFNWLPNEIGVYDLIVMACLHRLSNPKAWLVRLWEIIRRHGLLIIKPNDDWDQESLRAVLGEKFTFLGTRLVTSKSDMCQSSVTIWRLKH